MALKQVSTEVLALRFDRFQEQADTIMDGFDAECAMNEDETRADLIEGIERLEELLAALKSALNEEGLNHDGAANEPARYRSVVVGTSQSARLCVRYRELRRLARPSHCCRNYLRSVLMEHTPTPWFNAGLSDRSTHYIIRELDDGRTIATVRVFNGTESEANAAFIVRACNAHDELVAALEAILARANGSIYDERSVAEIARAALAKQGITPPLDMRGWAPGLFGHCYKEDARGLLFACPQNSNGTPDDREDATDCVLNWEDNEGRNVALRWWAAR